MHPLIDRLRSRKVVQWTLAYLAGAFVVLQLLDILAGVFAMPAFVMRAVTILLAAGALAAVIIAWYHGEKGQQRTSGLEVLSLAFILVLTGAAMVVVAPARNTSSNATSSAPAIEQASVAVLPFVNMSTDKEQEFFGDGITEEILNVLAQLPGLRVPGRTSSFSFKGKELSITEIARQLNVAHVLEGSVRKNGDKVRITAQLIDARTDAHLWSQTYDRDLSDVFAVQDEIAKAIVQALRLRIKLPADTQLVAVATESAKAHEHYLRGLSYWRGRHADELLLAIDEFKAAIAEDGQYAPAYAGLALTYAVLPLNAEFDRMHSIREGKTAAQHALQLDPDNALAHAALGQIAAELELDWRAAEHHAERSIVLDPANATAHQWRAEIHIAKAELDAALKESSRAMALDPLSSVIQMIHSLALFDAGRRDEALALSRSVVARDSLFTLGRSNFLEQLLEARQYDEALRVVRNPHALVLIQGIADPRLRPAALALLAKPEVRATHSQTLQARYYLRLGQRDSALAILSRAADGWEPNIAYYANMSVFASLRGEPRFEEFRRKVGLGN